MVFCLGVTRVGGKKNREGVFSAFFSIKSTREGRIPHTEGKKNFPIQKEKKIFVEKKLFSFGKFETLNLRHNRIPQKESRGKIFVLRGQETPSPAPWRPWFDRLRTRFDVP